MPEKHMYEDILKMNRNNRIPIYKFCTSMSAQTIDELQSYPM